MPKKHMHLLIVEDEQAVRGLLAQIFGASGYKVRCAEDGLAALRLIAERKPAVVLSDLNMPNMSGFDLLVVIRNQFPDVYVVAMSGAYSGRDIPDGVKADAFYAKGSNMPSLIELIASGVQWHQHVRRRPVIAV